MKYWGEDRRLFGDLSANLTHWFACQRGDFGWSETKRHFAAIKHAHVARVDAMRLIVRRTKFRIEDTWYDFADWCRRQRRDMGWAETKEHIAAVKVAVNEWFYDQRGDLETVRTELCVKTALCFIVIGTAGIAAGGSMFSSKQAGDADRSVKSSTAAQIIAGEHAAPNPQAATFASVQTASYASTPSTQRGATLAVQSMGTGLGRSRGPQLAAVVRTRPKQKEIAGKPVQRTSKAERVYLHAKEPIADQRPGRIRQERANPASRETKAAAVLAETMPADRRYWYWVIE